MPSVSSDHKLVTLLYCIHRRLLRCASIVCGHKLKNIIILILVSLFLAFVLNYVPEKWVLGLLGLIPIFTVHDSLSYFINNHDSKTLINNIINLAKNKNYPTTIEVIESA